MNENTSEVDLALQAMHRAAETARIRAMRYGSKLAVWQDGEVVLVEPNDFEVTRDGEVASLPVKPPIAAG